MFEFCFTFLFKYSVKTYHKLTEWGWEQGLSKPDVSTDLIDVEVQSVGTEWWRLLADDGVGNGVLKTKHT